MEPKGGGNVYAEGADDYTRRDNTYVALLLCCLTFWFEYGII